MTRSQAAAGGLLVAQAVVAYALIGISTLTLFLKLQPPGPVIAVPDGGKPVGE